MCDYYNRAARPLPFKARGEEAVPPPLVGAAGGSKAHIGWSLISGCGCGQMAPKRRNRDQPGCDRFTGVVSPISVRRLRDGMRDARARRVWRG